MKYSYLCGMKARLLLILCLTVMLTMTTQADTTSINLDTLYQSYMTDDVRHQLEQFDRLRVQLEQQEAERERRQTIWYIVVGICALSALTPTFVVFGKFRKSLKDRPSKTNIMKAAAITLGGGLVIFLIDIVWFYFTFEASHQEQRLLFFLILFVLGIALWIYTKNLNKGNSNETNKQ